MTHDAIPLPSTAYYGLDNKSVVLENSSKDSSAYRGPQNSEDLSPEAYIACAFVLCLIILFGVANNLFVILVIIRNERLWTPINVVLLNLSSSDLFVSAFGTPMCFASSVSGEWIFGEYLCKMYAFSMMLSGMAAIGTLMSVAFLRLVVIAKSFQGKVTHSMSYMTIAFIWSYALVLALPPLFGWNSYVLEKPGIACSLNWSAVANSASDSYYIIFIFTLGFFIPIGVITISYSLLLWMLKAYPHINGQGVVSKAEKQVTWMCIAMVFATLMTWTPYAVVSLATFIKGDFLPPFLSVIPALIAKSSTIFNPIIYFFFNRQIRDHLILMFRQWCPPQGQATIETSVEAVTFGNNQTLRCNRALTAARLASSNRDATHEEKGICVTFM